MNEMDIIVLEDENGEEIEFYLDASFEVDDELFAVLTEVLENEEDASSIILKVVEDNEDELVFETIDNEEELNKLIDIYLDLEESITDNE